MTRSQPPFRMPLLQNQNHLKSLRLRSKRSKRALERKERSKPTMRINSRVPQTINLTVRNLRQRQGKISKKDGRRSERTKIQPNLIILLRLLMLNRYKSKARRRRWQKCLKQMERLSVRRAVSPTCLPKTGEEDQEICIADCGISGGVGVSDHVPFGPRRGRTCLHDASLTTKIC